MAFIIVVDFVVTVDVLLVTVVVATAVDEERGTLVDDVEFELKAVLVVLRVANNGPFVFAICELVGGVTRDFCCFGDINLLFFIGVESVCTCES